MDNKKDRELEMIRRGIFHFHSCYSFDSITRIDKIIDIIEFYKLDFAVLTDHDTIDGCLALRDEARKRNINVEVPIAAEYKTDVGDIVVIGVEKRLEIFSAHKLLSEVKRLGGVTVLPHPYDGHNLCADLIRGIDVIEIFNGRSDAENDEKSQMLAQKYRKNTIFSSDAHLVSNLSNVIIKYRGCHSFIENCRYGSFEIERCEKSSSTDIFFSQVIKSAKHRRPKIAVSALIRFSLVWLSSQHPHIYQALRKLRRVIR